MCIRAFDIFWSCEPTEIRKANKRMECRKIGVHRDKLPYTVSDVQISVRHCIFVTGTEQLTRFHGISKEELEEE